MRTPTLKKNIGFILIILLALALQINRAGESFDGFHGFNEAWYAIVAKNYTPHTLLYPRSYLGTVDYNVPPLFSYSLFLAYRMFGITEFTARLVPIFSSMALLLAVFALANLVYGRRAAHASALLLAVMPAFVIIGRNVQVDSMYTALVVAFIYFYMRARGGAPSFPLNEPPLDASDSKRKSVLYWAFAGIALGAGLLAKQPAALALGVVIVWEIVTRKSLRFIGKQFIFMCATALVIAMSFYLPQLLLHAKTFVSTQVTIFMAAQSSESHSLTLAQNLVALKALAVETLWGMSPPIAALAAISLIFSFARPRKDPAPVIALAVFTLFFVFFHHHVYYMLPATVFGTLIAGSLWRNPRPSFAGNAALATVVVFAAFTTLFLLCKVKYGRHEFRQFGDILASRGIGNADIAASENIYASYGPVIQYYAPEAAVIDLKRVSLDADGAVKLPHKNGAVLLFDAGDKQNFPERELTALTSDVEGIELFGYVVHPFCSEHEPYAHTFTPAGFVVKKTGALTDFGFRRVATRTTFKFFYLPPNFKIINAGGVFKIVGAHPGD